MRNLLIRLFPSLARLPPVKLMTLPLGIVLLAACAGAALNGFYVWMGWIAPDRFF